MIPLCDAFMWCLYVMLLCNAFMWYLYVMPLSVRWIEDGVAIVNLLILFNHSGNGTNIWLCVVNNDTNCLCVSGIYNLWNHNHNSRIWLPWLVVINITCSTWICMYVCMYVYNKEEPMLWNTVYNKRNVTLCILLNQL